MARRRIEDLPVTAPFTPEEEEQLLSLPNPPQPYGDPFVVRLDGTGLLRLTHHGFEEGTPAPGLTGPCGVPAS